MSSAESAIPTLRLKPSKRLSQNPGHPWVFAGEVVKLPGEEWNGKSVFCRDPKGRFIGSGIYNGKSQLVWRRFSRDRQELTDEWLDVAIARAAARRPSTPTRRLVWSDSDQLPGLVVDSYGSVLVVQLLTLAMDQRREVIGAILKKQISPRGIVWRNDAPTRQKEGLERYVETEGNVSGALIVDISGLEFSIDPAGGQKTGFYLDQRDQYLRVAERAAGKRVLDMFCNQGGFALHCARMGAASVTAVDSSAEAIERGRQNAERNRLGVNFVEANAFDYLKTAPQQSWDLVILDPPPFAPGKSQLASAMRGYKEINLRGMQLLAPGGLLATYSCSHAVSAALFQEMLVEAASDAGREVRVIEVCSQPLDHPVLLGFPESEYLRGFVLEVN